MTSTTHAAAHADHVRWQKELAMWRDDIQEWRKEHDTALAALKDALAKHNSALDEHLELVGKHEGSILEAERFIAELERTGSPAAGEIDRSLAEAHGFDSAKQGELYQAHERIKRHHHAAMAKLGVLEKALGAGM